MSKKIITRVFTLMFCICSIFSFSIPVMAADSTSLYINVQYSDSISPEPDDKFVITYHAKNEEKTNEIVLNASDLNGKTGKMDFAAGEYVISDIEYQGYNTDVEDAGYAINSSFVISSDTNNAAFITLAIGEDEGDKLLEQYDNVIVKQYYQITSSFGGDIIKDPEANKEVAKGAAKERPTTSQKEENDEKSEKQTVAKKKEKTEKQNATKKTVDDHILMIVPLLIIACIVAAILYLLRKKNKI